MNIGVIGLGNLGTAIAQLAAGNGHNVLGWEHDGAVVEAISRQHSNPRFLPGIELSPRLQATTQIATVFQQAALVFITLPSRFIPSALAGVSHTVDRSVVLVNMSKGINANSGETAFATVSALFPDNPKAMLAGPSLANEFSRGVFTGLVAASANASLPTMIHKALSNTHFVITASDDPIGVELGSILKNIYALGLGIFDGDRGYGLNFVGAYLTQAMTEIVELGSALGGRVETFWQLCGLGDLIATALSEHSHNRRMGKLVASGLSVAAIEQTLGVLPEGYNTLRIALRLGQQKQIDLPLARLLSDVIDGGLTVDDFYPRFTTVLRAG